MYPWLEKVWCREIFADVSWVLMDNINEYVNCSGHRVPTGAAEVDPGIRSLVSIRSS